MTDATQPVPGESGSAPTPDPDGKPTPPPSDPTPEATAPGPASAAAPSAILSHAPPPGERPAARPSPYDHWLRVRGDVQGTNAVAVFLGGATVFLLLWAALTAGGPDPRTAELPVAPDGKVTLGEALAKKTPVWVEGFSEVTDPAAPLGEDGFRFTPPSTVELPAAAGGETVKVGYDLGSEPVVSNFVLPKPTDVLAGIVELATGAAFTTRCPAPACSGKDPIELSSSQGAALEAHRADAEKSPAPDIACPRCGGKLPSGTLAIATPAYGFRSGLVSTLGRTTLGFLACVLICLPLGILSGAFPPLKRFIAPVEVAGGYAPPVALLPLFGAIAGQLGQGGVTPMIAEDTARIAFLFLIASLWLYPLVVKEIEAVDQVFVNTAYTLGATRGQVVRNVLVPVASGKVYDHVRASYAIGWASIILAEAFIGSRMQGQTGIGFFMNEMQRRHHMVNYFAAVLAIIATGIVVDWLFRLVGRWLFPWQEAR